MSNQKLYIPKRINVGFQERQGTYTGLLAYVIYWDDKGKLRKEASWESWRHKPEDRAGNEYIDGRWVQSDRLRGDKVTPKAFDNVPTEGFVLNKGVGGQRESYGWNARNEYIRVYDPRGFEFEISVANLLYILQECTSTKGKGLEGEFVYSWDGTELVLLPVSTYEYQQSSQYTGLQSKKVTKDDIIEGGTYLTKQQETLIYLGRFDWYDKTGYYRTEDGENFKCKKYNIFYNVKNQSYEKHDGYVKLGSVINKECVDNYSELVDGYLKSQFASKVKEFILKPATIKFRKSSRSNDLNTFDDIDGSYIIQHENKLFEVRVETDVIYNSSAGKYELRGYNVKKDYELYIENGAVIRKHSRYYGYNYNRDDNEKLNSIAYRVTREQVSELEFKSLVIVTDNGGEIKNEKYGLYLYKQ